MRAPATVAWKDVVQLLLRRQGLLDAVVFSGGEPTLHDGLADAVQAVRDMGFRVGLHTAGSNPERLHDLLPLVDWVGMDVKAPFADYKRITGITDSGKLARQSVRFILESGVACEFRTTVHSALLDPQQWLRLGRELAEMGVQNYVLQEFRQQGCIQTLPVALSPHLNDEIVQGLRQIFPRLSIRCEVGNEFQSETARRVEPSSC